MESTLETLAIYMKPIGVTAFSEALYRAAAALEEVCGQASRTPLRTLVEKAQLTAPEPINGWTLPDALWLVACKRAPEISAYPLGEIAERAFKRTLVWLAVYAGQDQPCNLDAGLEVFQKNLRKALKQHETKGVQAYFLSEYFYEVCRDSKRRSKTGTKDDPCYRYHFPDGETPRSLADERKEAGLLLAYCRKMSDDCLPALLESLAEKKPDAIKEELSRVYLQSMGRLPKEAKSRRSRKPPLNVIVGGKSLSELRRSYALDPDVKRLLLHVKKKNISFDPSVVEDLLARELGRESFQLHSLSRDMLDVGVVMYIADQAVKRERNLKRRLDILMPVRHPRAWNRVKALLAETVSILGRDEVSFHFMKKKERAKPIEFKLRSGERCVSLFSGGLDSAAGALQILEDEREPVLVSHYANGFTSGLQKNLVAELDKKSGQPIHQLSVYANRSSSKLASYRLKNYPKSPMTQYLRSFMFLSIAAVVAVEAQIGKVYIYENGPVALNPMISEARLNTRTAHPRFIAAFQALVEALFKVKLEIENPFLAKTKGQVVSLFEKTGSADLLKETNSCWNAFAVPIRQKRLGRNGYTYRDDGDCLPCVIRRAAVWHAGLAGADVRYLIDVFNEFPSLDVGTQVMLADYLRFCKRLRHLPEAELLLEHPDFSVYAPGVEPKELVSMYRRHAQEMLLCFCELAPPETARRLVPPLEDCTGK